MKLICWNCQGLGSPLTIQSLQALVAQEKPTVLCLLETKNREDVVKRMQKRLKFQHRFTVSPRGLVGGLALFWNEQVTISIISTTMSYIDLIRILEETKQRMRVTFVYPSTDFQQRVQLWEEIYEMTMLNRDPWLCVGDFNEILYQWEKVGGRVAEYYRCKAFQDFINECGLMDLEGKGCAYTWANNRDVDELIRKRPDRALCSMDWRVSFPSVEVFALPAIGSDHSPILLNLFPQ